MSGVMAWVRRGRGLSAYAAVVVAFMVLVILEGAVVRATGSGAGCGQHWPLCNGEILPHHPRLATIIEFAHRSLTGICVGLTVVLIAWTFAAKPRGSRARRAVVWSGILLLTEGAFGAVLVLGQYVEHDTRTARVFVQGIHFTNTMLLLGAYTLAWWWMRERTAPPLGPADRSTMKLALLATMLTGATGSVAALADTLFPSTSLTAALAADFAANAPLLVRMRWIHPASAALALIAALALSARLRNATGRWILALIAMQLVLGVGDVLLLAPTWMQVLHLLGADLFWIALVAAGASLFERSTLRNTAVVEPYVNAV